LILKHKTRDGETFEPVGPNWVSRFIKRRRCLERSKMDWLSNYL
jgi:hypothetical protein